MFHSIDHSLLSPNGHMSKRARGVAIAREAAKLFPVGFWDAPVKTDAEKAQEKVLTLRRAAQNLRDLAARGMSARKFMKAAEKMEAEALDLEAA